MADVVLVKARDGYQVAFGLAELADKADGAPLSGKDGALKLVAEGDPAGAIRPHGHRDPGPALGQALTAMPSRGQ